MSWPRWSPDESIDAYPSRAMLTDRAWDKYQSWGNPHSFESDHELWGSRRDWALEYELGGRAYVWGEREWWDHKWNFVVSWPGGHNRRHGEVK